jgi:hypothetical protein
MCSFEKEFFFFENFSNDKNNIICAKATKVLRYLFLCTVLIMNSEIRNLQSLQRSCFSCVVQSFK